MRLKSIQLKPIHLTEEEAIEKAEEIRDNLVIGAEIISSFDTLNSETDYEELYKQLENIPGINTVWRMKYYHLLFPTFLAPFYGQDIQLKVLHFLKQNPSSIPFIRMGQIALFIKKCNIPGIVFDHIWGKYANDANTVDTSDTNTLSDKNGKPTIGCIQSLMITVGSSVRKKVSWFWAWNFANTLSVNDVIFRKTLNRYYSIY